MQNQTAQNINIKEIKSSEGQTVKVKTFLERFTCENILKILYLVVSVSFAHGMFASIIYFMAKKKYGVILTIGAIFSGTLKFLYKCYKILYNEELLIKKMILKNQLKIRLINDRRLYYNYIYRSV